MNALRADASSSESGIQLVHELGWTAKVVIEVARRQERSQKTHVDTALAVVVNADLILRRWAAEAHVHAKRGMLGRKLLKAVAKCAHSAVLAAVNQVDRPVFAATAAFFDDVLGDGHHGSDPHPTRNQHDRPWAALVENELAARHQGLQTKANLRIVMQELRDKRIAFTAPDRQPVEVGVVTG